jgi:hypothetical protein
MLVLLAALRRASHAEFATASLAPVLLIAWVTNRNGGLLIGVLATATWIVGDLSSGVDSWQSWVPWANGVMRMATYSLVAVLTATLRESCSSANTNAPRATT